MAKTLNTATDTGNLTRQQAIDALSELLVPNVTQAVNDAVRGNKSQIDIQTLDAAGKTVSQ